VEAPGISAQTGQPPQPAASSNPSATPAAAANEGSSATASQRPEWVPESHWDAEAGSLKLDEFGQHYSELAALKREHDEKLAAIPQKPEDVKFSLPEGFEAPEGFALDDNSPMLADAREIVVAKKIDPTVANEFLGVYVKHQLAEQKMLGERLAAEQKKLGQNVAERVDALSKSLTAAIGKDKTQALIGDVSAPGKSRLFTASQVEALESLLNKLSSQGASVPGAAPHTPQRKELSWVEKMYPKSLAASARSG
jgi:hypothetical protein